MVSAPRRVIAMTGDSDFLYPLAIAMVSLACHSADPIHLDYAIPEDWESVISEEELTHVERLAESLNWSFSRVICPIEASRLPRTRHISSMTFMKPAYFDVTRHSFVAFLDGDLIAVSEWTSIFNSLGEFAIGACKEDNMFEFERAWAPHLPTGWYINAGVLSAQPRIWQARYSDKWRGLLANYPNFGFKLLEQDLMNAALLGETAPINAELNVRPAYGHPLKDASIVHYAGWWKPWLTVDSEVKALTPVMLESLVLYKRAEAAFEEHLTLGFESSEARFWARAKTEVRGRLNWRAHWRYRRWDGTRRARRLLSSIRSVSRS